MSSNTLSRPRSAPTFVLVHGSGSSSFMWAPVQRELALLGHRSFAVDLPGHGLDAQYPVAYQAPQDLDAWAAEPSTLATVTLRDNADLVVDAVRRLAEHGPVVLVGASLGGTAISVAGNLIPDLVDRLVYISAWSCVERANPIEYFAEPEFATHLMGPLAALNVGDPAVLGVGRANYRTADPELLTAMKAAIAADVTDEQFRAFLNILQPDESIAVMTGDAPGRGRHVGHDRPQLHPAHRGPFAPDRHAGQADRGSGRVDPGQPVRHPHPRHLPRRVRVPGTGGGRHPRQTVHVEQVPGSQSQEITRRLPAHH